METNRKNRTPHGTNTQRSIPWIWGNEADEAEVLPATLFEGQVVEVNSGVRLARILLIAGLFIGLVAGLAFAWLVWPVEWTDADVCALHPVDRAELIEGAADLYAFSGNATQAQRTFDCDRPEEREEIVNEICRMAGASVDWGREARLTALVQAIGGSCP